MINLALVSIASWIASPSPGPREVGRATAWPPFRNARTSIHSGNVTAGATSRATAGGTMPSPQCALVCQSCGERFYDRAKMRRLEALEDDLAANKYPLREVGKVLELITA